MSQLLLSFPVKSFKKFENPYDAKKEPAKFQFFISVKDVPSELMSWRQVNPREQKLTTDVARDIAKSLRSDNLCFHLLNRGILVSAKKITYDNQTKIATLELSEITKHGIIDGGHTFRQIIALQQDRDIHIEKFVQLEVITDVQNVEELAEARNNSVAVDDKSIEELKGSFDEIKNIINDHEISGSKYYNRISFRQNEFWGNKDVTNIIDVREIIAIINMFNPLLYDPMKANHPIQSYSGKEVSLSKFLKLAPKGKKTKSQDSNNGDRVFRDISIKNMCTIIPKAFELWDKIEQEFASVSHDIKKRYGSKPYSNLNNDKIKKLAMFANTELIYTIPKGILYPTVGAFRALIKVSENGECCWAEDPIKVWEINKEKMVSSILDNSPAFGNSPDQIGKSSLIWDSLFNTILIYRITNTK